MRNKIQALARPGQFDPLHKSGNNITKLRNLYDSELDQFILY